MIGHCAGSRGTILTAFVRAFFSQAGSSMSLFSVGAPSPQLYHSDTTLAPITFHKKAIAGHILSIFILQVSLGGEANGAEVRSFSFILFSKDKVVFSTTGALVDITGVSTPVYSPIRHFAQQLNLQFQ